MRSAEPKFQGANTRVKEVWVCRVDCPRKGRLGVSSRPTEGSTAGPFLPQALWHHRVHTACCFSGNGEQSRPQRSPILGQALEKGQGKSIAVHPNARHRKRDRVQRRQ